MPTTDDRHDIQVGVAEHDQATAVMRCSSPLNLPNAITLSRLLLAGVLFTLIDRGAHWGASTVVFIVAAATDALDGYIARRYGLVTVFGRILDPFVDKVIVCGAFVFLLAWPQSGVNAWMVIIVIGREMFVTSLRSLLEQEGQDFSATLSGKLKMVLQCVAVATALLSLAPEIADAPWAPQFAVFRNVMLWSAVAATVASGVVYVLRAIKLFGRGRAAHPDANAHMRP